MDNTTRARRLAKWMRKQDWYDAYFNNLCDCYGEPIEYALVQSFCDGHEGEFTIEQAFMWKTTPEGYAFWEKANSKLKAFIKTIE